MRKKQYRNEEEVEWEINKKLNKSYIRLNEEVIGTEEEEWRPVLIDDGYYKDYYQVSNKDRVKSVNRTVGTGEFKKGCVLLGHLGSRRRKMVMLHRNNCNKPFGVDRLVDGAFPPDDSTKVKTKEIHGERKSLLEIHQEIEDLMKEYENELIRLQVEKNKVAREERYKVTLANLNKKV